MTARQILETALSAVLPEGWRLVPIGTSLDTVSKTTLMLKQGSIEPALQAPAGVYVISYTLTLISPHQDDKRAELDLDESVLDLLDILDGITFVRWTRAEKVLFEPINLAYDVRVEAVTRKDA